MYIHIYIYIYVYIHIYIYMYRPTSSTTARPARRRTPPDARPPGESVV